MPEELAGLLRVLHHRHRRRGDGGLRNRRLEIHPRPHHPAIDERLHRRGAAQGQSRRGIAAMNLALWLERVGLSHGDRPALGLGARVVRNYAEVAGRVARLAASLRQRFGLAPGERVAIVAKNSPDYLELMFGIWHAGLAAVPANAKLHGRELAYILEHSGARVCFASHGLDARSRPHAPATLERLITIGSAEYEALFAADPIGAVAMPRRRSRLAVLHLRDHRPAQGRHAHASRCSRPRATLMPPKSIRLRRAMRSCTRRR